MHKTEQKPRKPRADKGIPRVDPADGRNNLRRIAGTPLTAAEFAAVTQYAATRGVRRSRALYEILAAGIRAVECSSCRSLDEASPSLEITGYAAAEQ